MISSPRKTRRGSWSPLVENRDEWGSLFRGDPIKIKNQAVWASPQQCPTDSSDEDKNNGAAVDSRPPERLSDNRTMSYGCESQEARSHRKQGGMDEIHLFGIHGARKIRRDDRGPATRSVRRML